MNKGKIARLAGFVGVLGATTVLITTAVTGTGAYFSASQGGTISGSAGAITISANSDTNLHFDKLIPGAYKDQALTYTVGGDSNVDTWLVFADDAAYCQFSGAIDDTHCSGGGLGRFGHFAVANNAGTQLFSSYNLASKDGVTPPAVVSECANDEGHGSAPVAASYNDFSNRCGVPLAIKLESNLAAGSQRNVDLTFGLTPRAGNSFQNLPEPPALVDFKVVATQPGIAPNAQGF